MTSIDIERIKNNLLRGWCVLVFQYLCILANALSCPKYYNKWWRMNNMKCTIAIFFIFFLKYYNTLVILFRQIEIVLKDSTAFVYVTKAVESYKMISIWQKITSKVGITSILHCKSSQYIGTS